MPIKRAKSKKARAILWLWSKKSRKQEKLERESYLFDHEIQKSIHSIPHKIKRKMRSENSTFWEKAIKYIDKNVIGEVIASTYCIINWKKEIMNAFRKQHEDGNYVKKR